MCDDEDLAAAAIVILLSKKKRKPKRFWSKEWFKKRSVYTHERLLKDLATTQLNDFQNYLRMDFAKFNELLLLVAPLIQKNDTLLFSAYKLSMESTPTQQQTIA